MCLMIIVLICSCSNDLTSLGKHRNKDKPTLDSHLDNIDFIDNCTGAAVTVVEPTEKMMANTFAVSLREFLPCWLY